MIIPESNPISSLASLLMPQRNLQMFIKLIVSFSGQSSLYKFFSWGNKIIAQQDHVNLVFCQKFLPQITWWDYSIYHKKDEGKKCNKLQYKLSTVFLQRKYNWVEKCIFSLLNEENFASNDFTMWNKSRKRLCILKGKPALQINLKGAMTVTSRGSQRIKEITS